MGNEVVRGCARAILVPPTLLPSAKKFVIAAMLLRDEDKKGTVLFHSVIFNSVLYSNSIKEGGEVRYGALKNIY